MGRIYGPPPSAQRWKSAIVVLQVLFSCGWPSTSTPGYAQARAIWLHLQKGVPASVDELHVLAGRVMGIEGEGHQQLKVKRAIVEMLLFMT